MRSTGCALTFRPGFFPLVLSGCFRSTVDGWNDAKAGTPAILDSRGSVSVCEVHHQQLIEDKVPIAYGLFDWPKDFELARTRFPHAWSCVRGCGCVVQEEKQALVLYCPQCREAEKAWLREMNEQLGHASEGSANSSIS